MIKLTLNEKIALKLHKGSKLISVPLNDISCQTMTCLNNSCRPILNYTGNWNDLIPLVVEYKILENYCFFIGDNGTCQMHSGKGHKFHVTANTHKRALAECLLKVLQGEQANEL